MTSTCAQRDLIESTAHTVLGIAGPGSGKTRTVVERYLFRSPWERRSVLITFTNASALELTRRIRDADGEDPYFCGTLHAFCLKMLRDSGRKVTVIDEETKDALLKECAEATGCKASLTALRAALVSLDEFPPRAVRTAIQRYVRQLQMENSTDFDLILVEALALLKAGKGPKIDHLYVDEFQDAASIDAEIYRELDADFRTFIADGDQAIYSFRGGSLTGLQWLLGRIETHVVKLEENFRSDTAICATAQKLIDHDPDRFAKETRSVSNDAGTVGLMPSAPFATDAEEMAGIVSTVRQYLETHEASDIAVLCRYNLHRIAITDQLTAAGLMHPKEDSDKPRDWSYALLSLACWGDPENQITARAWWKIRMGPTVAERHFKHAAMSREAVAAPLGNKTLNRMMEEANLSRGSRQRILDAVDALSHRGAVTGADILLFLQESAEPHLRPGSRVQVLTMHGAKGLEFDAVILPAFEDEVLPGTGAGVNIPEARRIAYVAMTRARHTLYFSFARARRSPYGRQSMEIATPSRFLTE